MAVFTIAGTDRSEYVRLTDTPPRITMLMRQPWTAEFVVADPLSSSSAYRPALNDTVVITDGANTLFRGWVFGLEDGPVSGPATGTAVRVFCQSHSALLDSILVDETYGSDPLAVANSSVANPTSITTVQPHGYTTGDLVTITGHEGGVAGINGTHIVTVTSHSTFTIPVNNTTAGGGGTVRKVTTADDIVADLHATYLDARGVTLDTLSTGPVLDKQVFSGVSLRQALDHICQLTGWIARVTPEPELQFFSVGTKTAPYSLTAANNLNVGPVTWSKRREKFVNKVYLRYGTESIVPKTDVFTGDGSLNSWQLRYQARLDDSGFIVSRGVVNEPTGSVTLLPVGPVFDITSSSVANPTVITCPRPHGVADGGSVVIQGHSGSTPSINGTHTATVLDAYRFTIPVNVTVAGSGGSGYNAALTWHYYSPTNTMFRVGALTDETTASFTYDVQFPQVAEAEDSTSIGSIGEWAGRYEWPECFDVDAATAAAAAILTRESATPAEVSTSTRQTSPVFPGDQITLTYSARTVSGSHLIQQVDVTFDADKHVRYMIRAVSGSVQKDGPRDIMSDALGFGGLRAAGGTVTGGLVPGSTQQSQTGLFPGKVVANLGQSGLYATDDFRFEITLSHWIDADVLGPALILGRDDFVERWVICADYIDSLTRLRFLSPDALSAADYHVQFYIPGSSPHSPTADVCYITPHGDAGGALYIGGPVGIFGNENYRVANVYTLEIDVATALALPGAAALTQVNNVTNLLPNAQTINNGAVVALGDNSPTGSSGFLFVEDVTNAVWAIFYLRGGSTAVSTVAASSGWSTTAGTGSSRNVYWSGGNSRYELENNIGSNASFRAFMIGLLN